MDEDSYRTTLLRPVQTSGKGVLTADARITSITPTDDWGESLKVLRGEETSALIGFDDKIHAPNSQFSTVVAPWTSFVDGDVLGGTTFVVEEFPRGSRPQIQVDMEWECPERREEDLVEANLGYTVSLADLDCLGSWSQKLTMRVRGKPGHRLLSVELYGMPDLTAHAPLTGTMGAERFEFSIRGLTVAGRLISENSNEGASVFLERVDYKGVPVCETGLHTIATEE